ncbi:MAG: hypothetical protein JXJ04_15220 [Spirochaetales bacterium]|nr:hypothetical protein [Spirochaetales bacterium]
MFPILFTSRYKDLKSFRSGYAGNLSLIFDSEESQSGNLNKFTKTLEPILKKTILNLKTARITFDDNYCIIEKIPDELSYKLLSVFFNLKPINALINRKINLSDPEKGWLALLLRKFNKNISAFLPHPALETGRGAVGSKSILNRYTIYNRGYNWFDVIKPNYYNFKNLRYKIFLQSLLIEQDNLYYCFIKSEKFDYDYNTIFENVITVEQDEPAMNSPAINELINFEDILLVRKNDIHDLIIDNVELPKSYQYMFAMIDNSMVFTDGSIIDLTPFLITDYSVLEKTKNINPNITFNEKRKQQFQNQVTQGLSSTGNINKRLRRLAVNGEESHTVMKFIDKSYQGKIILRDYFRDKENNIRWTENKTCLILYNGTRYPDLVCVFLEDAVKVRKIGSMSISEYSTYIWENYKKFKHLFFEVEVEFNLTSFKSHDNSLQSVLQSKYIFCENMTGEFYNSQFNVTIPVISILTIK